MAIVGHNILTLRRAAALFKELNTLEASINKTASVRRLQICYASRAQTCSEPLASISIRESYRDEDSKDLAPVVLTLDRAIYRIKIYPVDNAIGFPNTYPLDSDLSGSGCSNVG